MLPSNKDKLLQSAARGGTFQHTHTHDSCFKCMMALKAKKTGGHTAIISKRSPIYNYITVSVCIKIGFPSLMQMLAVFLNVSTLRERIVNCNDIGLLQMDLFSPH